MRKRTGKLGSQGVLLSESRGTQKAQKRPPDLQRSQQETIHNKYIIELEKMGEVAKKKGFTLKKALLKKDIFTTLSEQLGHILREKIEEGNLRTVVADYLRRCQSTKDNSLEEFLIGTTLAEVLFSVERGDDVDGHVIISAVCNAMNVEVLLLASFGGEIQEVLFQPRREKEFLPTLIIGTISGNRLFRFELDNGPVPPDAPPTWSRSSKDPELVTLRSESAEFQEVKQSFLSSIGRSRTYIVIQIKRVQSITQWVHFKVSLEQMAQKYPKMISERLLWHGTSATSIKSICKDGFNRSFCGKNATRYGEGTYFSRASSYAAEDTYSVPGWDGTKYMFRARVLTGLYTKGESDMKVPPYSNEAELTRFDSVVDNVDKPSLFVIFNDTKAYPEYLIKFRETVHKTVS